MSQEYEERWSSDAETSPPTERFKRTDRQTGDRLRNTLRAENDSGVMLVVEEHLNGSSKRVPIESYDKARWMHWSAAHVGQTVTDTQKNKQALALT